MGSQTLAPKAQTFPQKAPNSPESLRVGFKGLGLKGLNNQPYNSSPLSPKPSTKEPSLFNLQNTKRIFLQVGNEGMDPRGREGLWLRVQVLMLKV